MSFRSQFLHLDSANATQLPDTNNSSGVTSTPYKANYKLNQVFTKIKRVYLNSVELPIGFTNIRKGSTDVVTFILNGTTYSITLTEKNYTTVASLITDINTAITALAIPSITVTLALTSSTSNPNRLLINFTGTVTTFSIVDTNLSKYILGFRAGKDALVGSVYSASTANYNLNPDNYIVMYVPTLNAMNASMSNQLSTYKIPLNSVNNQVFFYVEEGSFRQWVDITDSGLTLSNLTVILYDKYGKDLNPNNLDFSFTMCLELWD